MERKTLTILLVLALLILGLFLLKVVKEGFTSGVPGAPKITGVLSGDKKLTVTFDKPTVNPGVVTGYQYSTDGTTFRDATTSDSSSTFIEITTISSGTTGALLTNEDTYTIKIKAKYASGTGDESTAVTGAKPSATAIVPNPPTITSVVAKNTQLEVNFTPPILVGTAVIDSYEYNINSSSTSNTTYTNVGTTTNFTIQSLTNGTEYTIKLRAVSAAGNSTDASSKGTPRAATAPQEGPKITKIEPGNANLKVFFTAPTNTGGSPITSYKYSTNDGDTYASTPTVDTTGTTPFFTIINDSTTSANSLKNGTEYKIKMKAVNAQGDGQESITATAATPRTTPGAPKITSISAGDRKLSISFEAPTSNGGSAIIGYKYSTNDSEYKSTGGTIKSPIVITGLVNNKEYRIRLRAINVAGDGLESEAVTSTPKAGSSSSSGESTTEEDMYKSMRDIFMEEVKDKLKETLQKNSAASSSTSINSNSSEIKDSCLDSIAKNQGKDWMKYIPGKNPDDYIRKDSIPCWGCSL
jgi:hypothetical protein